MQPFSPAASFNAPAISAGVFSLILKIILSSFFVETVPKESNSLLSSSIKASRLSSVAFGEPAFSASKSYTLVIAAFLTSLSLPHSEDIILIKLSFGEISL